MLPATRGEALAVTKGTGVLLGLGVDECVVDAWAVSITSAAAVLSRGGLLHRDMFRPVRATADTQIQGHGFVILRGATRSHNYFCPRVAGKCRKNNVAAAQYLGLN